MSLRRYVSTAAETTLTAGVSAASTAMTLTNPSGYPTAPFGIRVDDEGIVVGTNTAGVLTDLDRGYDGTSVVAHTTSVPVNHVAFGEDFRNRWLDVTVDRQWASNDDEFGEATMDAAWIQVTPTGSAVWTQQNGVMSAAVELQSANDVAALIKPISTFPPHTLETAVRLFSNRQASAVGLIFTDGITVSSNAVGCWLESTATAGDVRVRQRSGTPTAMTGDDSSTIIVNHSPWLHIRLAWKTINTFKAEFSPDGVSWAGMNWPDIALTFTPTHAGLLFSSWGDTTIESKIGTFEYYRTHP